MKIGVLDITRLERKLCWAFAVQPACDLFRDIVQVKKNDTTMIILDFVCLQYLGSGR